MEKKSKYFNVLTECLCFFKMTNKNAILLSFVLLFISQKLYCKNWNIDVIGKDILLPGDEVTFVVYTTEKKDLSNVIFTIYEKSTRKKISSISGQGIAPYPPKGKEYLEFLRFDYGDCGTAYAESWKISDIRKKDDCSELWYYIEASINDSEIIQSKPFRVRNPHIVEYKLLTDRGNHHTRGVYYREYVSLYIKACDLDGMSDYLKVEYTEKDETTDETQFFTKLIPNKGKSNIYETPKFRLVTTNNKIDWTEKCKETLEVQIYPQVTLYNERSYLSQFDSKLMNDFDEDLSTFVGVGILNKEVPGYIFKDMLLFSNLLKQIEKEGCEGYSAIVFNNGEFVLQL